MARRGVDYLFCCGNVERQDAGTKGRSMIVLDGVEVETAYSRMNVGMIIIANTEVPGAPRGLRVGE